MTNDCQNRIPKWEFARKSVHDTTRGFWIKDTKKVYKLQKSIDGLKQLSRSWKIYFDETIREFSFNKNEDEPYIYKMVIGSAIVFIVLYVDDILFIGNNIPMLQSTKIWLSNKFSMMDLGKTTHIEN